MITKLKVESIENKYTIELQSRINNITSKQYTTTKRMPRQRRRQGTIGGGKCTKKQTRTKPQIRRTKRK